jgi:hypothetical protein
VSSNNVVVSPKVYPAKKKTVDLKSFTWTPFLSLFSGNVKQNSNLKLDCGAAAAAKQQPPTPKSY